MKVLPEENDTEEITEEMQEVDYADAIPSLYGAKVIGIEDIRLRAKTAY